MLGNKVHPAPDRSSSLEEAKKKNPNTLFFPTFIVYKNINRIHKKLYDIALCVLERERERKSPTTQHRNDSSLQHWSKRHVRSRYKDDRIKKKNYIKLTVMFLKTDKSS